MLSKESTTLSKESAEAVPLLEVSKTQRSSNAPVTSSDTNSKEVTPPSKESSNEAIAQMNPSNTQSSSNPSGIGAELSGSLTDKKFHSLNEILAAFGRFHPMTKWVCVWVFVVYFTAWVTISVSGDMVDLLLTPVRSNSTYCNCELDVHKTKQELLIKNSVLDEGTMKAGFSGTILAFGTMAIQQKYGRKKVLYVSLIVCGGLLLLAGGQKRSATSDVTLNRLSTIVLNFASFHILAVAFVNALEWVPAHARPLVAVISQYGMTVGRMTVLMVVYFVDDYNVIMIVGGALTTIIGIASIWLIDDSPFYQLSKSNSTQLQACFEKMERWGGGAPAPAEKLVDDVAFEVFEGTESGMDAFWKGVGQIRLSANVGLCVVILWATSSMRATISENNLDLDLGPFERVFFELIFLLAGQTLALFMIRPRRHIFIIVILLVMAQMNLVQQYLVADTYSPCMKKMVRTDIPLYIHMASMIFSRVFQLSMEVTIFIYEVEIFPTAARTTCIGLQYLMLRCLGMATGKLNIYIPSLPSYLPLSLCFLATVLLLCQQRTPIHMRQHYVDLRPGHKKNEVFSMPAPKVAKWPETKESKE